MNRNRSLLALVGTVVVAIAAFAVIVPDRSQNTDYRWSSSWLSHIPEVAVAESLYEARWNSMIQLRALLRRLETRTAARALAPAAEMLAFTADPRLPADTRAEFAEAVRAEFSEYPAPMGRVRVHLAVASGSVPGRYERSVVLPSTVDDACTVIIDMPETASQVAPRKRQRLVGTCGFYARFGAAGSGMRAWLEETRGAAAATDLPSLGGDGTHADTARRQRIEPSDVSFIPLAAACAADNDAACTALFGVRERGRRLATESTEVNAQARDVLRGDTFYFLSSARHLAAMRAELGDARFTEVWRSAESPTAAYETLEGRTVGALVRAHLLQEAEPRRPGPLAARFPMLLGLAVAGLCGGVTVRVAQRRRS